MPCPLHSEDTDVSVSSCLSGFKIGCNYIDLCIQFPFKKILTVLRGLIPLITK